MLSSIRLLFESRSMSRFVWSCISSIIVFHRDTLSLILSVTSSLIRMLDFSTFMLFMLCLSFYDLIIWPIFESEALIDSISAYRFELNSCSLRGLFKRSVVVKTSGSILALAAFAMLIGDCFDSSISYRLFLSLVPRISGNFGGPLKDRSCSFNSSPSWSLIVAIDCITGDFSSGL